MKKIIPFSTFTILMFCLCPNISKAQDTVPKNDLSALVNYNFSGSGASFNTIGSEVYYGFRDPIAFKKKDGTPFWDGSYYEISPSITTPINLADQKNYLPGLLLPGSFNIVANLVFKVNKFFYLSPFNLGAKVLSGYSDSGMVIIQDNIHSGFAIQNGTLFALQFQYTWAWHNATTDSEDSFNYVFNKEKSNIQYITATLQTRVSTEDATVPTYLIIQFRDLMNAGSFTGLKNSRIISMGIRASVLDLNAGTAAKQNVKRHKLVSFRN